MHVSTNSTSSEYCIIKIVKSFHLLWFGVMLFPFPNFNWNTCVLYSLIIMVIIFWQIFFQFFIHNTIFSFNYLDSFIYLDHNELILILHWLFFTIIIWLLLNCWTTNNLLFITIFIEELYVLLSRNCKWNDYSNTKDCNHKKDDNKLTFLKLNIITLVVKD